MNEGGDIVVRERGEVKVTAAIASALLKSRGFWELCDRGIVSLRRGRQWIVSAGPYVGQALLEGVGRLVVREKSPGALRALLRWAAPGGIVDAKVRGPVGGDGSALIVMADELLKHTGTYLASGKLKRYDRQLETTASPRGQLVLRATVSRRARGMVGTVICRRERLSSNLIQNHLLSLAIAAAAELYASSSGTADRYVVAVRYQQALWERSVPRRIPAEQLHRMFEEAIGEVDSGSLRSALAYGRAVLLSLGVWPGRSVDSTVPHAFFLRLENLFEEAVRGVLSDVLPQYRITLGREWVRAIFPDHPKRYRVDPDFVMGCQTRPVVVGDCKYKELSAAPSHSDVYQLICHSLALEAQVGILVYPGRLRRVTRLGWDGRRHVEVFAIEVRPERLRDDILECMRTVLPLPRMSLLSGPMEGALAVAESGDFDGA